MSKHTPGPWHYDKANDAIYNNDCAYICDAPRNNKHDVQLIASAPELLEALEKLMFWLNSGSAPSEHAVQMANQAIAKAKGE